LAPSFVDSSALSGSSSDVTDSSVSASIPVEVSVSELEEEGSSAAGVAAVGAAAVGSVVASVDTGESLFDAPAFLALRRASLRSSFCKHG
jgi:hypothetical protein